MKIGNVFIENNVFLAPMAGVTNLAYRRMAKAFGAGLVYSEMISDKGIYYNDKKTIDMGKIDKNEHPIAIQIFGGDIDTLVNAAKYVDLHTDADIIDVNMGCPVTKVLKAKAGSNYLLDPDRIYKTLKAICDNVSKPVTCKIRIGYDKNHINVKEVCQKIIDAGCKAITIHGRTKEDMYSNEVRYDLIKEVKEMFPDFPIIANGDIKDIYKAKEVLEYTKADGIMIGRASFGNPYIFKQINAYLKDGTILEDMNIIERLDILDNYAKDLMELKGSHIAFKELRGQASWFIKGIRDSSKFRNKISKIDSYEDLKEIIAEIKENI